MPRVKVFSPLLALLFASWVVILFQLMQVFFNAPLPIAFLNDPTANLVGSWNELGIFAGLSASLLLFVMGSLPLSRMHRILVSITLAGALFVVALVGFMPVWIAIATVSFAMLVYALVTRHFMAGAEGKASGIVPGAALVIALFFLFLGGGVTTAVQGAFHISSLDVRPSFQGTLGVLEGVYAHSPVTGSGPNTFSAAWLAYRPGAVLATPFWNTSFGAGAGAIPTAIATGGVVVAAGWIILLMALLYTVVRALVVIPAAGDRRYLLTAVTALGAAYLAAMHIIYAPGAGTTLLFFIMIGLLIASLKETRLLSTMTLSFKSSPRMGFASVLVLLLLVLGSIAALYGVGRTYLGTVFYDRAVVAGNNGDLAGADAALTHALLFAKEDQYYRAASVIDLAHVSAIVSGGSSDAAAQTAFQNALTKAVQDANAAVALDPNRYENIIARANVYGSVVPLKIDGAYDRAIADLAAAAKLSPQNPEVDFRVAEAKLGNGDSVGAEAAVNAALAKKPDYTDAILLLAQIELNNGDIAKAIESVKGAVYFQPTNPTLLYQLGVLLISNKEYQDAATALEAAVAADGTFANAKFFLAEAYAFLGKTADATTIMAELAKENPDNATVAQYQRALEAGTNPFDQGTPPPATTGLSGQSDGLK